MPVKPEKRACYVYAKDIMALQQRSLTVCRRLLGKVRKAYGIPPYYPVPLPCFLDFIGLDDEEKIRRYFPQAINPQ